MTLPRIGVLAAFLWAYGLHAAAEHDNPGRNTDGERVPYRQPIPGSDVGIEMVPVPAGTLRIAQQSTVEIQPLWIAKYEITLAQYAEFMKLHDVFVEFDARGIDTYHSTLLIDSVSTPTPVYDPRSRFEYFRHKTSPASSMSQFAARQFTKWLSLLTGTEYRLPTETEWQYACLAGSDPPDLPELELQAVFAQSEDESRRREPPLLRVGTRQPNAWGIFDMRGNVAEYVIADAVAARTGPLPEAHVDHRAYGGSFLDPPQRCRFDSFVTVDDEWWNEDADYPRSTMWLANLDRQATVGFRIVRPTKPMTAEEKKIAWEADSKALAADDEDKIKYGRGRRGRIDHELPATIGRLIQRRPYAPWKHAR